MGPQRRVRSGAVTHDRRSAELSRTDFRSRWAPVACSATYGRTSGSARAAAIAPAAARRSQGTIPPARRASTAAQSARNGGKNSR